MTKSGCPEGGFWHKGTRYHDTEDSNSNNNWSDPYHLAGRVAKNNMEQKFCMKTLSKTSKFDLPWPKGEYCIYKKGNRCPDGQCIALFDVPYFNDESFLVNRSTAKLNVTHKKKYPMVQPSMLAIHIRLCKLTRAKKVTQASFVR